jgi:hypothetical protein
MGQIKAVAAKRVTSSRKQNRTLRSRRLAEALQRMPLTDHVDGRFIFSVDEISSAGKWQRNPKGNGRIEGSVIRFDEMMDHPICLLAVTR